MKRRAVIIGILLLLVLGIVVGIFALTKKGNDQQTDNQAAPTASVQLQGANNDTEIDPSDNAASQKAIQARIHTLEPDSEETFIAVVRKGSIVRSTTSYGAPKVRYLVDIPQLQRTLVVEREGDEAGGFASIYILCPTTSELRYAAKPCSDSE